MRIEIMSINCLLSLHYLKNSLKHVILFISTRPNYYDFGCTNFALLRIEDNDNPLITVLDKQLLLHLIDLLKKDSFETLYVCCDAGISRSPAVALYIVTKIGDEKLAKNIKETYKFLNYELFDKLMNGE